MCIGTPLFIGNNEKEVVKEMVEILGSPPVGHFKKSIKINHYREELACKRKISLDSLLNGIQYEIINLIKACLEWDYIKRITSEEALKILNLLINSQ